MPAENDSEEDPWRGGVRNFAVDDDEWEDEEDYDEDDMWCMLLDYYLS